MFVRLCARARCVCVCVGVHFTSFIYLYRESRELALGSAFKTDQDGFTDSMSFLPSNLKEEISANT